jgi:hypothetical protein
MALGVTHKWPKAFPVIGFFGAKAKRSKRRIPILRSAYVPREALGITASGSFAPRAPCTHSSLWMTVSKKGIYTFPAQLL